MTKVYLYGELRNKFGHEFNFHIGSPKEALLAIKANKRNFDLEIKRLAANGVHYRVVVDEEIITTKEQLEITKIPKEVHIIPIVWGAGKNGVLIAVGVLAIAFTAGAAAGERPHAKNGQSLHDGGFKWYHRHTDGHSCTGVEG
jgi:predicted phage tail protein